MTTQLGECWDCHRRIPSRLMAAGRCATCGDDEMTRLKAAVDERDERIRELLAVLPPRRSDGRLTEEQTVAFLAEHGRDADGAPLVTQPVGRPRKPERTPSLDWFGGAK
jgi:hypothetical protein